jgi:hypothetical protein
MRAWFVALSFAAIAIAAIGGLSYLHQEAVIKELHVEISTLHGQVGQIRTQIQHGLARTDRLANQIAVERRAANAAQDCLARSLDVRRESGKPMFAFVRASDEPQTVEIDRAEWLSGQEANRAAAAAGVVAEGEAVPNDYFIANAQRSYVPLKLPRYVVIAMNDLSTGILERSCVSRRLLSRSLRSDHLPRGASPFWISHRDGEVTELVEQYTP